MKDKESPMRRGARPAIPRKGRKGEDSRVHDLETLLAEARQREAEALEREKATSEVLRIISSFPTDIRPVFDAIAAKAPDLCRATTGWVYRFDGELIHIAAAHSLRPEAVEVVGRVTRCLRARAAVPPAQF